jgi:hypothetical protein
MRLNVLKAAWEVYTGVWLLGLAIGIILMWLKESLSQDRSKDNDKNCNRQTITQDCTKDKS